MIFKVNLIKKIGNDAYLDCFDEIETCLKKKDGYNIKTIYSNDSSFKNVIIRFLNFINFMKLIKFKNNKISFSILIGSSFGSLIPFVFLFSKNFIYMYDAWPRFHKAIAKNAKILNIKIIFFSSYKATNLFNELNSGIKGMWIPEGINIDEYHYEPFKSRKIDVVEFGRKYEVYHDKIVSILKTNNYSHFFEKNKGEVVFRSRLEFLNGLSQSKISICIPSNITHPERAEGISSMTLRYLQSMASKCLIVGILPEEMKILFDYIPIIEIDLENASSQILDILSNYESYIPLVERNYEEIKKFHTWDIRTEKILLNIINESAD